MRRTRPSGYLGRHFAFGSHLELIFFTNQLEIFETPCGSFVSVSLDTLFIFREPSESRQGNCAAAFRLNVWFTLWLWQCWINHLILVVILPLMSASFLVFVVSHWGWRLRRYNWWNLPLWPPKQWVPFYITAVSQCDFFSFFWGEGWGFILRGFPQTPIINHGKNLRSSRCPGMCYQTPKYKYSLFLFHCCSEKITCAGDSTHEQTEHFISFCCPAAVCKHSRVALDATCQPFELCFGYEWLCSEAGAFFVFFKLLV